MKAKPKACSRTSRGSTASPKSRFDPASLSRARPNASLPAKAWKASKPIASSQTRLTPGSRSHRSLSLLFHQSENLPDARSPDWGEGALVHIGITHQTLRDEGRLAG